jgi:acetyltransferase-like isoleucine patch superfamily enzyme
VRKGASIGSGTTILSNTTIGENAIVGAGSVVTKDVPANCIVAGNPAKLLRSVDQTIAVTK